MQKKVQIEAKHLGTEKRKNMKEHKTKLWPLKKIQNETFLSQTHISKKGHKITSTGLSRPTKMRRACENSSRCNSPSPSFSRTVVSATQRCGEKKHLCFLGPCFQQNHGSLFLPKKYVKRLIKVFEDIQHSSGRRLKKEHRCSMIWSMTGHRKNGTSTAPTTQKKTKMIKSVAIGNIIIYCI